MIICPSGPLWGRIVGAIAGGLASALVLRAWRVLTRLDTAKAQDDFSEL